MEQLKSAQLFFDTLNIGKPEGDRIDLEAKSNDSSTLEDFLLDNSLRQENKEPVSNKKANNISIQEKPREQLAPMMKHYLELKRRYPEYTLLYQVGDFYEIFFEDALIVSEALGIRLTSRDKDQPNPIPMCGVPIHAIENYVPKLLSQNLSCVIVSQIEEDKNNKGLVRREISRIVTPGVRYEGDGLDEKAFNYLAGAVLNKRGSGSFVYVDVSTGHLRMEELETLDELLESLQRIKPAELILPSVLYGVKPEKGESWIRAVKEAAKQNNCHLVYRPFERVNRITLLDRLSALLPTQNDFSKNDQEILNTLLAESLSTLATTLDYIDEVSFGRAAKIASFKIEEKQQLVFIDNATRRNLELVVTRIDAEKKHSLLGCIDYTVTAMGARLLREWVLSPSSNLEEIKERHQAVGALLAKTEELTELRRCFSLIRDLDRLTTKITSERAGPRDLSNLRDSLLIFPQISNKLLAITSPLTIRLASGFDLLEDVCSRLKDALVEEPPLKLNEGEIFKDNYHPEIDRLRTIRAKGKNYLQNLEEEEKRRTGINGLKIKYNSVFGYFIEVTKANLKKVPAGYERKQTLVNAERFITPELKQFEHTILTAKVRQLELEKQLFLELRNWVASQAGRIQKTGTIISTIDVLQAFAFLAREHNYCCPEMVLEPLISIADGRHPVVERVIGAHNFVANDTNLDCAQRYFAVITGPNMGGKSTYLRQVGLIQILAQAGSYIPAKRAKLGMVDRIFTRIGSSDDISRGDSTFMVEMREASTIVKKATSRSLVLIDEIGRGTATTDGLAIATAIGEWLHDKIGCRTLFATHFHELTALSELKSGVSCLAVGVIEKGKEIIFTHRIEQGAADRSYGIEVARLAGLPERLLARAQQFLENPLLDNPTVPIREIEYVYEKDDDSNQGAVGNELSQRLRALSLEEMKPIDALLELSHLKELAEN